MDTRNNRSSVIDALRGYFILWIGLYNTFAVFNAIQPNLILSSILLFINDKGWFCLSAIFGYGFGQLIKHAQDKPSAFPKRMLLLFLMGIVNNLFFYGDILKEYAIIGLILFYTRPILAKKPVTSLLFVCSLTCLALYYIPFDMKEAGNPKEYFHGLNIFLANLKYCISLNLHSLYFTICYHLEMLLMALIGFFISFFHLEEFIVIKRFTLLWISLSMMFVVLTTLFLILENGNPLLKICFFIYILSLSISFVIGFFLLIKKYNYLSIFFIPFGRRSLTIYLLQNIIITTIWLWDDSNLQNHFNEFFLSYCAIQLVLLFISKFFVVDKIGILEMLWRKWSQS
ncbi:hypothetical protein VB776_08555 [Arcicella sp. DC2W]|uniref:DUF418 domain-containing protein n=1 Tax=Arcicella gelida TaxID=2984195 RepID=A0ABU5S3E9_9BACT|nr:hypothetical protein [Arcicella sp. DC2W]MEA5402962.1 hypothetical protein [Arcicella sp. DC2W]